MPTPASLTRPAPTPRITHAHGLWSHAVPPLLVGSDISHLLGHGESVGLPREADRGEQQVNELQVD